LNYWTKECWGEETKRNPI